VSIKCIHVYLVTKFSTTVIHGQVDHLSLANTSAAPRHTYQLHLVEGPQGGVNWSKVNWNQYPDGEDFQRLIRRF